MMIDQVARNARRIRRMLEHAAETGRDAFRKRKTERRGAAFNVVGRKKQAIDGFAAETACMNLLPRRIDARAFFVHPAAELAFKFCKCRFRALNRAHVDLFGAASVLHHGL
jgi:hypothetical protein